MATYTETTKYLLRKITGSSNRSEIDDGIAALADNVDANMAGYADGTLAAIPGAGKSGRFYRTTDTGQVFMDTGSVWIEIGVSPWQPGDLKYTANASTPSGGWLPCDGAAVSRTTYAALYAALGGASSPYGQGNGSTTFNTPDARSRALLMPDGAAARMAGADTRGGAGGAETVTLAASQVPDLPVVGVNAGGAPPPNIGSPAGIRGASVMPGGANYSLAVTSAGAFDFYLIADGGGQEHVNMPPYLVVGGVWIKT